MQKKIYYHDTDCGGVVYYANYFKYFEEARTEFLVRYKIDLKKLQARGIYFAVKTVEAKYKSPARYGETIDIATELKKLKHVTMLYSQTIQRGDTVLVEAHTQLVCVSKEFSPMPIPEDVRLCLKSLVSGE